EAQEAATRKVLLKEQASRALAEQQKQELEKKQARIDQLVLELGRAPTEEEVENLKQQVQAMQGQQGAQAAKDAQASAAPRVSQRSASAPVARAAPASPPPVELPREPPTKAATITLEPSQKW